MKIQLLVREYPEKFGLSRYTRAIATALRAGGLAFERVYPHLPAALCFAGRGMAPFGFDLRRFFSTYPLAAPLAQSCLKHFTAQQMAVLLLLNPRTHPVVVSVHDILPYMLTGMGGQDVFRHPMERLFDRLAMKGLQRAGLIIANSGFTRRCLVEELGIRADKIRVVHLGVDHQRFRPLPVSKDLLARYALQGAGPRVLYVGAELPRKNLPVLLAAMARVKGNLPGVKLIKVGGPEYLPRHRRLLELIEELDLRENVRFTGHVPPAHLVQLYCLADVFVFPSLYEGFGLPVLEAMACGAPVVCSTAPALKEVAGEAALLVDPGDVGGWARAIERVITDRQLRQELSHKGLERARGFSWARAASQTLAAYAELLSG
ncbi:MAG: glycosyltransferase family 1 protein [Anaerolineales bacterium]